MVIDAKIPEGYIVLCNEQSEEHVFLIENLGIAVQCPKCGRTALSVDLANDFVLRNQGEPTNEPSGL